ncbi:outer membrane beta-barrel protein [Photobacterium minamisatsumaniensis]|uniref:outer membrane beta-barrel protein n=1 Tax=Photobacterium minamisatsumaniensis TaxID=2910233 RepID=UPI003D14C02B
MGNNRYKHLIVLSYFFLALQANAHVQNEGNIGVDLGYQQSNGGEASSYVYGVFGGYKFDERWNWNIGLQSLGNLKGNGIEVDGWLQYSTIRYSHRLSHDWSLYSGVGMSFWSIDKHASSLRDSDKGISPVLDFGGEYILNDRLSTTVGYRFINDIGNEDTIGSFDSHSVILSLKYWL